MKIQFVEEDSNEELVKKVEDRDKLMVDISKQVKKVNNLFDKPAEEKTITEIPEDAIPVSADNIYSAIYLIRKKTKRGSIPLLYEFLRDFFNSHKVIEPNPKEYYIVKNNM